MAVLFVYMNGLEVGEYIQHRSGAQEFIYSDTWLRGEAAMPISLSMPLTQKSHKGDVVYNFFDNLLPDNKNIRQRIQKRFGSKTDQAFDLLSSIGQDCVGAVQLLSDKGSNNVKHIKGDALNQKDIATSLRNYQTSPLGMPEDKDFRISLAGAQEKTAFLWHQQTWQRPIDPTPTTHIFKQPIGMIEHANIDLSQSVKNEWLCLKILQQYGLPVAQAQMAFFEDREALIVERFDRKYAPDNSWIIRQPQEDMCQALGIASGLKYEVHGGPGIKDIMQLLSASITPNKDRKQFMKSVFLFWVLGAIDGHAKNFSVFLHNQGRFELSPLYDVISAYPLTHKRQLELKKIDMAMALHSKNKHYKWSEIMPRHWLEAARQCHFPESDMLLIIDEVIEQTDEVIAQVLLQLPEHFPEDISQPIFSGIKNAIKRIR